MGQYQRKHQRKNRRVRFGWLYGIISGLLILAAVVGGCIVFFRVDTIEVQGNSRYSQQEIIDVSGVEQGDNMFLLNKFEIIDKMLGELTYLDDVTIRRGLPSTLKINVTECTVAGVVRNEENGEWWLVSSGGKLLERQEEPGDYMQVTGLTLAAPSEGTMLAVKEEQQTQSQALLELLEAMESRGLLGDAQSIDVSTASTVTMEYAGRLTVKMKMSADFDYDMRVLATVMEEYVESKWSAEDTGTLDMTLDDGLPHLIKNAAEN